jgi:hypothetical protein
MPTPPRLARYRLPPGPHTPPEPKPARPMRPRCPRCLETDHLADGCRARPCPECGHFDHGRAHCVFLHALTVACPACLAPAGTRCPWLRLPHSARMYLAVFGETADR